MNSIKNRFISGLLSFVMMFTLVMQVMPPIMVHAADGGKGGLKISSPSDGATINGFETVTIKWNRYSGADHYLLVIKDETTGQKVFEEDVSYSSSSTRTYNIYSDDEVFTEDGHEYKIYVVAMDENDDELNNGAAWHAIYVDNELELETPEITSHDYLDTHCIDDTLYVEWDPVDGADDYTVYVKKLNGDPNYGSSNESGTNITYTWSDDCEIKVATSKLVADKWYKIALCATNTDQDIDSEWTEVYILMEESSYLNVSEYPDDLDAEKGSTGSFWIESNLDWDISCDVSWVTWTINQVDGTHAEIIVKATSANTGTSDREAEFTISADGVDDEYVYVTQLAPEIETDFVISSIKPFAYSVNTQVGVDFTVTTNSATKYGVDIYAGEYHLERITSGTKSGNQIIYTYKGHKFTSAGTKTIYAYPVTASNEPDKSISSSCRITVNAPYGRIGNPGFTTANNQTIAVDNSFSIAWTSPSAPSSGITYNVYIMKAGTNDNRLVKEGITSRSCSIPASFFANEGQYVITLYALAPGYAQNATGATLVVNVKNEDSVYVMSVTPSTTATKTLTDVDFTIKASTSAKYGVAIYAGKYYLATVKNKTSYSGYIKYVYENHNFTSGGVKNIYVYPLDASGNIIQDEGAYATCSIQVTATSACGSPSISTATNQTINFNSDFKVAWRQPSVPSTGVRYNVYVRHSYSEDGEPLDNADRVVNSSMITSTSLTIDSSYFTEKGSYTISVYAMAPGYTQSSPAAITVYVTDGYRLQVNAKELTAYEGGGKGNNITVTANIGWSVSSDVNWISFSTSSGNGNGQFYPIIDANDSAEERSGNIIVSGGGITRKILVKQGGVLISTSAQEDTVYNQPTSQLRVTVKEIQEIPAILTRTVLVSNATVTYGNTTVKTDKDGIAVIPYDVQSGNSLVVSKSGYSTQTIAAKWLSVNQGGIEVTLNPLNDKNEPTINAVWVLGSNILKESYAVDLFSTHSISFTADVDWGNDSYGSISLWQNGKQVKFNGDKLQTVLSEKFDVSQAIYIVAINASGKETREKLNLKAGGGYPDWLNKMQINFADKFSVTLPSSAGIFAGAKIGIDFNGLTKIIPISVIVEGNKVYASIGVELVKGSTENGYLTSYEVSYGKNEIKTIKDTINKYKNSGNASPKKFFDTLKQRYSNQLEYPGINFILSGKVNVIGYVEGYLDSNGNLILLDNGLILNPSVSANWGGTFTVPVAPMVPLVWEVLLKGDFKFITNLYVDQKAKDFTSQGEVKGDITVNGGLGVGVNNVASVTGGVEGVLKANYAVYRDGSDYFKLDAGIGLYGKIKVAIFEHTFRTPKAETTLYENPSPQTYRMYALANEEAAMLGDYSDTSVYELQNREYLDYYSGFIMNENAAPYALARTFSMRSDVSTDKTTVFYENIYPNAEPVIGTFDDGTMIAVYIGDDTTRTDINRTRLYYSFYNGIEWSQPVPVDAYGKTADFSPALVIAQNKAFITWQDATKTFSNSDSLESIAPYFDISIAVFDPTNKNIVTHTIEYTGLDMTPNICANDNNVSVVWVNNALNDWYGCNNANSILAYTYTDNGWGNVVNLKSSLTSIRSIDAQYIGNVLNTIYSIDTDNNVETVTDINTYLLRNSSNTIIKSNSGVVNSAIIRNGTIYWQENGNIMYCDVNNLSVINSIFSSDVTYSINAYNVLDNGYEKYAIMVIGDGLYSKLGISVFDDSSMTWSDIVYITDGSNMISDYDAVITSDGFVRVIATQTAVLGDMSSSNPYGLSDIIICDVYINGDLTVEDVTFDMSKTVGDTTAEVYAHVVNNGKETIDSSVISIYDRNWNLISTSIDETEIKPGAEATLIAYMDIDDAIIGSNVIVVVKPRGINDVNQTDNSIEVTVNYFDVAVEQIAYGMKSDGKAVIYANIVNRGYRTENNITAHLRKGSADASIIATTQVSSIGMFDLIPVQFAVTYEEGAVYYITISENDGDMMTSNNQDFVVLVDESETPAHLLGDVNLDGQVTADDATNIMEHLAGMLSISNKTSLENADVDKNGLITADDATKIMEYLAGMIGRLE